MIEGSAAPPPQQALVVRVDFGGCTLRGADGSSIEATARGRLMGRRKALGNKVVVGDLASLSAEGERVMIDEVASRRNAFSRRAAGERAAEQVVAANIDQVLVVAAVRDPEFRPGFVDRVLAQTEHARIPARLVLNKCDLSDAREWRSLLEDYGRAGYSGLAVSARTGQSIDPLRDACRGLRSLLIGHSGVGKSTLLNALFPDLALREGAVNFKTGKGRHTTTAAVLLFPEPNLELIDTPGVRTFGLWGVGAEDLEQAYPEFRPHLGQCRFADCKHSREPGCALLAARDAGAIPARRMESFLKLREELRAEAGAHGGRIREPDSRI